MPKPPVKTTKKTKPARPAKAQPIVAPAKPRKLGETPRRVKQPVYKSLKLQKRIKHPVIVPSIWQLTKRSFSTVGQHKSLFFKIVLAYAGLNLVLVHGLTGAVNVSDLKSELDQTGSGGSNPLGSGLSIFGMLVSGAGSGSADTASAYQLTITIIASLAIIWALRQVLAGATVRARDAYYKGMYPLVPFALVLAVCALQFLPLIIGSSLYNLVTTNGIAVYAVEKILWGILYFLLALLTLYMVSSSLFALYIVTLPDMTPFKALRSARQLVRHRRWTVLRKIVGLPIVLGVIGAVIMVPVIIVAAPVAQWMFFGLSMIALVFIHSYMYTLYRELLNE